MQTNYNEAKEDLKIILDQKDENVTYDDSLKQIVYTSKSKDFKDSHLDKEKMKVSIFLFLFFFTTMLIAGWKDFSQSYVLYSAGVGLLISLVCSITKDHTIIIDFEKKIIRKNNKSICFDKCKVFIVETVTVNLVSISYTVVIETSLGKVNFPLVSVSNKDMAYNLVQWANKYI